MKKFHNVNLFKGNHNRRLSISDIIYIDPKKKIILLKRDDTEHLIYCSDNNISVIETIRHE
ncbi:MAG: hypothetical protein EOP34_11905 [Rickettsiales bacterium]|nr:MAG: hypothetical protein EOP34_11905 [Rickettsiales bacterium]